MILRLNNMPRLVLISDTHSFYETLTVPDGDILIHSGDFGARGALSEVIRFNKWLGSLSHSNKIFVAGNHDWCFEREKAAAVASLTNARYLEDEATTCCGISIYGSPWQPRFFDWAFNVDRGEALAAIWSKIPEGIDVLVTHGPPFEILDQVPSGECVGCEDLLRRIEVVRPKLHVFGHIHEGYGVMESDHTLYVNASSCNGDYELVNQPIVIDI